MNKIALITGASSGVGENMARIMIKNGWMVIGLARRIERLNHIKSELGEKFLPIQCDVSQFDQVKKISDELKEQNLLPSFFFLGAGIREREIEGINLEIEKRVFAINYFGVIAWIEQWLEHGLKTGSIFICMSSSFTVLPSPRDTAYCASKSALKSTFEALRILYANAKASFVTVIPGAINTSMVRLKEKKNTLFIKEPHDVAMHIFKQSLAKKEVIVIPHLDKIMVFLISLLPKKRIKNFFDKNFE